MQWLLSLPVPLLFVVTMTCRLFVETSNRNYSKKYSDNQLGFLFFNGVSGAVCALVLFIASFSLNVSLFTICTGLAYGVITMMSTMTRLHALSIGPWAYTSVIIALSTLIPTFSGVLFWDEKLTLLQIIGIVLIVVCVVMSVQKKQDDKKANKKWLILSLIAACCSGSLGVMQKIHQSSSHKNELMGFLIVAFLVSSLFSLCILAIKKKKGTVLFSLVKPTENWKTKLGVILSLVGLGMAVNNVINLHLSGVINSAVFFPIINGGHLVMVTLFAVVVYKEKLTLKQTIGVICGILSVVLLCLK